MTASEWRARSAEQASPVSLELPSGMIIKARKPGPLQLALWGHLPLWMAAAVAAKEGAEVDQSNTLKAIQSLRDLLSWVVVEPRISNDGEPETIHPRDICDKDLEFLVFWAQGLSKEAAAQASTFRGQPQHAGDRGDSAAVPSAPVATPAHRGPEFEPGL